MGKNRISFFQSIKGKILIPVIILLAILGTVSFIGISILLNFTNTTVGENSKKVFDNTIDERVNENVNLVYSSILTIADRALQEVSFFTKIPEIQNAYRIALAGDIEDENSPESQEARELLRIQLRPYMDGFKEYTGRSLIKIHFHLPNARSLTRLWREGYQTTRNGVKVDISDDLSSFRNTVLQINSGSHKPITGIEVGRGGFAIRGLAPLTETNGKHLGSVEILFAFNEIFDIIKTSGQVEYAVYMDEEQLLIAKSLADPEKYPVLDNTYILTDATNKEVTNPLSSLTILNNGREEVYSEEIGDFIVSTFPIWDFSGKTVGVMLQSMNVAKQRADFATARQNMAILSKTVSNGTGIGFLLAIIVLSIIIILIINKIIKPLTKLNNYAGMIAEGNFNISIEKKLTSRKDETGILSESFSKVIESLQYKSSMVEEVAQGDLTADVILASENDMLGHSLVKMNESLNSLLSRVNNSIDQVNSGADQVAQASQSLSQGATEQASSLEEISASITQINSQSKQNAENATEANAIAKQAVIDAEKGNKQMEDLRIAMEKINASSDQIKKIVKVIDDIAFQTNLLALNANVEAARAGKYGKGFAVVADEVRNLAVRSSKAVKETTEMVEESIKNITAGNKGVEHTSNQLESIMTGSSKIADFLEEITMASKEQAQAIDQITTGLDQIDEVTQSNTASAEESAAASEELASQSQELKKMIATFKLKQSYSANDPKQLGYQPVLVEKKQQRSIETGIRPVDPSEAIALDDEDFDRF